MAGLLNGWITEDPDRDRPEVATALARQWENYHRHAAQGTDAPVPPPVKPERRRARGVSAAPGHFLHATPADTADAIRTYLGDAPVETVWFFAGLGGMPEELVRRHVTTLCTELAPRLRTP
ncbi:hypothetical protein [Streptodolium elevatio]